MNTALLFNLVVAYAPKNVADTALALRKAEETQRQARELAKEKAGELVDLLRHREEIDTRAFSERPIDLTKVPSPRPLPYVNGQPKKAVTDGLI